MLNKRYFQPKHTRLLSENDEPLETGILLVRQMPNTKESHEHARRVEVADEGMSLTTLMIFIL